MSTSPAPEYALSFSSDAVHLMERSDASAMTAARWRERASAPFDAPDFRSEMARLRKLVANGPDARVSLIIPDDQILYTSLPMGAGGDVAAGLGQALDGLTPYPVAELAWDWRPEDGQDVRVAAVARQTLREAEDFARRHGFDADGFLADPAEGLFPETPRFVDSAERADAVAVVAGEKAEAAADTIKVDEGVDLTVPAPDSVAVDADKAAEVANATGDSVVAAVQTEDRPDIAAEAKAPETKAPETKTAEKAVPESAASGQGESAKPAEKENAEKDDGLGVGKADGDQLAPAVGGGDDGVAPKADSISPKVGVSEAAPVAAAAPATSTAAPVKPGSRVTDFLPQDLPSAVPDAAPAVPAAPPSELIDAADMPSHNRAPQPLPDRAKAVLDRAAAARTRRDSEPAVAPERHPGARGGIGGLLLMLGALLLGLMLIWSFATPEPRISTEPATTAAAPEARTAVPGPVVQTSTPPETVSPARSDAAPAAASGTGVVPADQQIVSAPASVPAPATTQPASSATETPLPSAQAPTTQAGTAAETPAAVPAAPVATAPAVVPAATVPATATPAAPAPAATVPTAAAPAATPATKAPAAAPAPTSTRAAPAATATPSHAETPKAAPAKPAATRPSSASRPSTAPRRSQPAAAPAASDADQLPAVVPGRRALTRSERPAERPRRATTTRAPEAAAAPAHAAVPAASAAPARASRPASAPRSAPRSDRATSAPAATSSAKPTPRPRPRPEEGSADESVTAAEMTAAERAVADGWLADLYRQNPSLPRLAAAAPQKGLIRLAEARPTRRPVADKTAVDAAVAEAAGTTVPRKKKAAAATDGDRPAARSKAAAPKAESSKAAPSKAAPLKTQTARTDSGDRPASRPSRKSAVPTEAPASAAAVESAIAEAVGKSVAKPGKVAASAPAELVPPKKPSRKASAPDPQAEAVAAAVAAPAAPAPAPAAPAETRTASRAPAPAVVPAAPPADDPAVAAQRLRDEQLQAQAEARARAGADAAARTEMQARAAAEARARAQEAAEERAAIASRGEYRPPELDDEPEVGVTPAKGTSKGQVASAATVGGMEIGKTQVIGVIGAGRASRGLIRLRNGKIVTVRLGDRIDGGAINSIGNGRISYVKGGRQFNLPILNGR